jgi:hypothetical protein
MDWYRLPTSEAFSFWRWRGRRIWCNREAIQTISVPDVYVDIMTIFFPRPFFFPGGPAAGGLGDGGGGADGISFRWPGASVSTPVLTLTISALTPGTSIAAIIAQKN